MKAQVYAADGKIQIRQDGFTSHRSLPWSSDDRYVRPVSPSLWTRFKAWVTMVDDNWFQRGGW